MTFAFHPEARVEFREAAVWYEEQRRGLGERFQRAVRRIVNSILADPVRFRPVGEGVCVECKPEETIVGQQSSPFRHRSRRRSNEAFLRRQMPGMVFYAYFMRDFTRLKTVH